jgi:hypothetical protein
VARLETVSLTALPDESLAGVKRALSRSSRQVVRPDLQLEGDRPLLAGAKRFRRVIAGREHLGKEGRQGPGGAGRRRVGGRGGQHQQR